jgi:predicted ester cyclase
VCDGFWAVEFPPSPNDHDQLVGEPVEVSVKVTFNGAVPERGEPAGVKVCGQFIIFTSRKKMELFQ